jgi:FlaA1/EpsC-like NDP-sugar epimerase
MSVPLFSVRRRLFVLLIDAVVLVAAYASAYWVRLDLMDYPSAWRHFDHTVGVFVVAKAVVFVLAGTYRGLMLYATIPDLLMIVRNGTAASLVGWAVLAVLPGYRPYSRGVMVIDLVLSIVLVAATRVTWRMLREGMIDLRPGRRSRKHVLIVGAGRAGVALAKDLIATRRQEVQIVGFVDDDPDKQGATLLGRPILGTTGDLPELRHTRRIDQVIAAIPSASPRVLRRIAELARGVRDFRIIPPLDALLRGKASIIQTVRVAEEKFLSRGAVDLAAAEMRRFFDDKTVLVTGAGGSIGGELARQLSNRSTHPVRRLLLLDSAETPLYDVHRQTSALLGPRAVAVLASVRDRRSMGELLRRERPDVILHAAALKHVPMCEAHPLEALATNAVATSRLADLALELEVPNFTLVSTDKAVAPACIMGASKRAAEAYVQSLGRRGKTCFAAVRFGNVLGSNGSVLPLFHEQIGRGGPVTVTDPSATRFFMTIPEACGLILRATQVAQGGEVYILDMGEPVRVLDVAYNLIRLYGYEPGKDIEVKIIGLRPGEKLHESLVDEAEEAEPLQEAKLLRIKGRSPSLNCGELMAALQRGVEKGRQRQALEALRALVPTFRPVVEAPRRPQAAYRQEAEVSL